MAYGRKSTASSILEVFTLNPLPYPVLLFLGVISIFLGISWFSSYESAVESAQEQMGLALLVAPVVLIILARWLSSVEDPMKFFGLSGNDRRHRQAHHSPSEGGSPWTVAVVIVVLLVLVQYQSAFHDSWFG